MYPVSAQFIDALDSSHTAICRMDVYQGGKLVRENVGIVSGSVTVDRYSKVRRTATISLGTEDIPHDLFDPLVPNGSEIVLYRGIDFGATQELCPLGVFRIDTLTIQRPSMMVTLQASDRGIMLQDDCFLTPQANTQPTVQEEIIHLARTSIAGSALPVTNLAVKNLPMYEASWEVYRWDAIDELAKAIGVDVYFDPLGGLVLRPHPTINDTVAWKIGEGTAGAIVSLTTTLSRLETYNAVVVRGGTYGTPPIYAVAKETDATSPTAWGGIFGHRPQFVDSDAVTTQQEADDLAAKTLAAEWGMPRTMEMITVPNPALDAGDVIEIGFPGGVVEKHMIDRLTIGLAASDSMTISTRTVSKEVI